MIVNSKITCKSITQIIIIILVLISITNSDIITANLKFDVDGNGFHRIVIYQVNTGEFWKNDCFLGLNLHIPSALYVNNDELANSGRLDNITACSLGETDIEVFAEDAKPQELTICTRFKNGNNILSFKLHQRYQRARNNESYVNITLPNPKLLLGCKKRLEKYPVSKMDICESCTELVYKWREIPYDMRTKSYIWIIPVGELSQRIYVTWITLFACIVGTIFIAKSLWQQR